VDTCDLCNKNLCEECKFYHFHIIKEQYHLKLDEEKLKSLDSQNIDKKIYSILFENEIFLYEGAWFKKCESNKVTTFYDGKK